MKKEDFIEKARKKHTKEEFETYSFETIPEKVLAKNKVQIYCHVKDEDGNKHGLFQKRADMFIFGDGCPKCRTQMSNTAEWVAKCKAKWKNPDGTPMYDYSKAKYRGSDFPITVICHKIDPLTGEEHGEWYPPARNHLFSSGCPACSGNKKYTQDAYIKKAQIKHIKPDGTPKYDYSKTIIKNTEYTSKQYITITCHEKDIFGIEHGDFEVRADAHMHKTGCPKCADSYKVSEEEFILRAQTLHDKLRKSKGLSTYSYDNCGFTIMDNLVFPYCHEVDENGIEHGYFEQIAYNHLLGKEGCKKCQAKLKSFPEYNLQIYIQQLIPDKQILFNSKSIIAPYELDIYIPEIKLAFEFNGLFYHNNDNVPKDYHKKKTELCESKGIHLVHIWEDDWLEKQEIIKSRIKNLLHKNRRKIFARNCVIKEVSNSDAMLFLDINHLQGKINSSEKYGLYTKDTNELVALMTFGLSRHNKNYIYELYRFCNKLNTTVIGAANKLWQHFLLIHKNEQFSIISYADRCWSSIHNAVYTKLGMTFNSVTVPKYFWEKQQKRYNREQFQKHKLVEQGYDPNKTEIEIMKELGYNQIFDSGNLIFTYIHNL